MRITRLPSPARSQRGAALLLFLIALVMAASYALLKKVNQTPDDAANLRYTMQQLKHARAALQGYALHGLDPVSATTQPGRLPCPDYNLDGDSDPCVIFSGYVQPGRLPWRTLGLTELRDADNEPLWYVPAIEFNGSLAINSNSNSTDLRLNGGADAMIAIVLSPGAVLGTQSRPAGNLVAQLDPARYFEDINSLASTAYVTTPASRSTAFNDRLLAIRQDRFMPELERRVLRELANKLKLAPSFPNPASVGTDLCDNAIPEGLLPINRNPATCNVTVLPTFPPWFETDEWQPLIWYVMDASGSLNILPAGISAQALLFSPGGTLTAAGQPSQRQTSPTVTELLEDGDNTDGNTTYMEPVNSLTNNDQLLIVAP